MFNESIVHIDHEHHDHDSDLKEWTKHNYYTFKRPLEEGNTVERLKRKY